MEKEKQTGNKGRLLVIDDNPNYVLNAVKAAEARGYNADVAFDLKGAMEHLQSRDYVGVITDLQFYEEGLRGCASNIRGSCKDANDLEGIVGDQKKLVKDDSGKSVYVLIFEKGTEAYEGIVETLKRTSIKVEETESFPGKHSFDLHPKANLKLRERIASELATSEYASQLNLLGFASIDIERMFRGSESSEGLQESLMENPAMGYEVIIYAQGHNIPVTVVSSVGHGQHCIPALFQTGLVDIDSLIKHESARYSKREEVQDECNKNKPEARRGPEADQWYEEKRQRLQFFDSILLDNTVLVMKEGKVQHTYDFAIDMLEGKIDQTRPYNVISERENIVLKGGIK